MRAIPFAHRKQFFQAFKMKRRGPVQYAGYDIVNGTVIKAAVHLRPDFSWKRTVIVIGERDIALKDTTGRRCPGQRRVLLYDYFLFNLSHIVENNIRICLKDCSLDPSNATVGDRYKMH